MKYRLTLKQQEESQQVESLSGGDLSTPTLLTTLGCSGILALNSFTDTGQLWISSFAYLMSLAMVAGLACLMKSRVALSEGSLNPQGAYTKIEQIDERAMQIATTPLLSTTHQETNKTRFEHKSPDVLAIEPCLRAHYLAFGIASVVSVSVTLMLLADWLQLTSSGWFARLTTIPADVQTALVLVGMVVVAAIINQLRKPSCRVVFDKARGVFWLEQVLVFNINAKVSAQMPIAHVIALQQLDTALHRQGVAGDGLSLLPFYTRSESEVNIVFRNTERVNLLHTCAERTLNKEIKLLAGFLEVPVWKQSSR